MKTLSRLIIIPCALITCLNLSTSSIASAQSSNDSLQEPCDEPGIRLQTPTQLRYRYERKSPGMAALISFGSTLAPIAAGIALMSTETDGGVSAGASLFSFGVTFGPSMGHYYAGAHRRGTVQGLVRAGLAGTGVVLTFAGVMAILVNGFDDGDSSTSSGGIALIATGIGFGVATGVMVIYGWIDAAVSARRVNRRAVAPRYTLAPLISKSPTGETQTGLLLTGRF